MKRSLMRKCWALLAFAGFVMFFKPDTVVTPSISPIDPPGWLVWLAMVLLLFFAGVTFYNIWLAANQDKFLR